MNDKRVACILLWNGLTTLCHNMQSKMFTLQDVELLEEIMGFLVNIHRLMYNVMRDYTNTKLDSYEKMARYYPHIKQVRQMSNFSIICSMLCMLEDLKRKKYFEACNKKYILNHFLQALNPSLKFLEKFLLDHPHFHVEAPVPIVRPRCHKWNQMY